MKISIIGTGGVGGYFGAKFKLSGNNVVFIGHGKNLSAYKKTGLILQTSGQKYTIKDAIFTDDYKETVNSDYIFITVKSYDTENVASQLKPFISPSSLIITIQNGIDNDLKLAKILGKENIIPGMTKIAVSTPKSGSIVHTSMGSIVVGEYDNSISERLNKFCDLCEKSGIPCTISNQILKDRWDKYIWNCTYNIISTVYKCNLHEILNDKQLKKLSVEAMKELYHLAALEGYNFDIDKAITGKLEYTYNLGPFKTSTLQDFEKGKPTELEAFTGYALKLAKKHGFKMPTNSLLYEQMKNL